MSIPVEAQQSPGSRWRPPSEAHLRTAQDGGAGRHLTRRRNLASARPPPAAPIPLRSSSGAFSAASRALDVVGAAILLIFMLPLMAAVAIAVWGYDGGPPVFAQRRLGKGGREFRCLKFRSMVFDAEARLARLLAIDPAARAEWERDQKLRRDPRITPVGRFLRTSSLDELPQLLNVLGGQMSLVGPRPIVPGEVDRYGRYFRHYCSVRPGLTGIWQVSGRNDVSYRRRVAMDVVYARERSLGLYFSTLLATLPAVLMRRGAS